MVALVIVLGIVIVWLVVLRFFIRPVSDERSLDNYHDTLDRLGKLADSTPVRAPLPTEAKPHAHVRVLWPGEEPAPTQAPAPIPARPPPERPPEPPPEPPEPPEPQTGVAEFDISNSATPVEVGDDEEELGDEGRPVLKFDDFVGSTTAGSTSTPGDLPIPTAAISTEHASDREALRAAYAGRHRWSTRFTLPHPVIPRVRVSLRILLALLATAFLVSLLVREFMGTSEPDTTKASKTEATSATVRRASTTTEASAGATPVSLVGSTATSREYEVGKVPFELTISARTDCWVQVKAGGTNGQALFTGTIPASERKSFTADGPLWVRIGVPGAVTLTIDDGAVPSLPSGSQPVNALFTPPAAAD